MDEKNCIFCKIVKGDIPSNKIYESEYILGFMDIGPLSEGHCLFIPKKHARKLHETDDESLRELLVVMKKVAMVLELENYNILQNNGKIAHQVVNHTHFHLIPKNSSSNGLGVIWKPIENTNQEKIAEKIRNSLT